MYKSGQKRHSAQLLLTYPFYFLPLDLLLLYNSSGGQYGTGILVHG